MQLLCGTVSGVGTGLLWRVAVLDQQSGLSPLPQRMDYAAPALSQAVVVRATVEVSSITTAGGSTIRLLGSSFGEEKSRMQVLLDGESVEFTVAVPHHELRVESPTLAVPRNITLSIGVAGRFTESVTVSVQEPRVDTNAMQIAFFEAEKNSDGQVGSCLEDTSRD